MHVSEGQARLGNLRDLGSLALELVEVSQDDLELGELAKHILRLGRLEPHLVSHEKLVSRHKRLAD